MHEAVAQKETLLFTFKLSDFPFLPRRNNTWGRQKKSQTLKKWGTIIINITPHAAGFIAYMHYLNIVFHKLYWMVYSALMKCRQRSLIRKQTQACFIYLFIYIFFHSMKSYSHKGVIFAEGFICMPGEMTDPICSYWYLSHPITVGDGVSSTSVLSGFTPHPPLSFLQDVTLYSSGGWHAVQEHQGRSKVPFQQERFCF